MKYEPHSTCNTGKQQYRSRSRAERAIKSIIRRDKADKGRTLNSYLCIRCLKWHIGHNHELIGKR